MEQIKVKVHLRCLKKPVELIFNTKKQLDDFFNLLATEKVVSIGGFCFNMAEFLYATVEGA